MFNAMRVECAGSRYPIMAAEGAPLVFIAALILDTRNTRPRLPVPSYRVPNLRGSFQITMSLFQSELVYLAFDQQEAWMYASI